MTGTIPRLISQLGQDGWGGLQNLDERAQEEAARYAEQSLREASVVANALVGPAGDAFIEWLCRATVLRSPNDEERAAATVEAYALAKAKREGQNSIFFLILAALLAARGETAANLGG